MRTQLQDTSLIAKSKARNHGLKDSFSNYTVEQVTSLIENDPELKEALNENLTSLNVEAVTEMTRLIEEHGIDFVFSLADVQTNHIAKLRFGIVKKNLKKVKVLQEKTAELKSNGAKDAAVFGLNFMHLFHDSEIGGLFGLIPENKTADTNASTTLLETGTLPSEFTWVGSAVQQEVQNQEQCGGCWAFATSEAISGLNYIQNGVSSVLSAQQLISCDTRNSGCGGGVVSYVWNAASLFSPAGYAALTPIVNEQTMPFTDGSGTTSACPASYAQGASGLEGVKAITNVNVANNANAIQAAIDNNPVVVSIYASGDCFQYYKSGTISSSSCSSICGRIDHAVFGVGWGSWGTTDAYFLIKNSWGDSWGESGYVKISTESACNGDGVLQVMEAISYPQTTTCSGCQGSSTNVPNSSTNAPNSPPTETLTVSPTSSGGILSITCFLIAAVLCLN